MKGLIVSLVLLLLVAGCQERKDASDVTEDTAQVKRVETAVTDDVEVQLQQEPPAAVDRLFDDFIYSFMRDPKFQMARIAFPLANYVDGVNQPINQKNWEFDPIYSQSDTYTMIFDSESSVNKEKDPKLKHVEVEWVYLKRGRVKQYIFDKVDGRWMLVRLNAQELLHNANSDFYAFFHRFATDRSYQLAHIENPFEFKTYDSDSFQVIEGLLDVAQWPDYCPTLPGDVMTNINYSQTYRGKNSRVLVLTSPSAGMSCTLVFKKKRAEWMLVGFENI